MEVATELEDDLFFADLSKQISLLIMDDDDHDEDPPANCPSVSLQAFSHAIHHPPIQAQFVYEQRCRKESKGTGVFIPQSTQPRRKQRQGRFGNSYYAKTHLKQQQQQVYDNNNSKTKMVVVSQQMTSNASSFKPKHGRA